MIVCPLFLELDPHSRAKVSISQPCLLWVFYHFLCFCHKSMGFWLCYFFLVQPYAAIGYSGILPRSSTKPCSCRPRHTVKYANYKTPGSETYNAARPPSSSQNSSPQWEADQIQMIQTKLCSFSQHPREKHKETGNSPTLYLSLPLGLSLRTHFSSVTCDVEPD